MANSHPIVGIDVGSNKICTVIASIDEESLSLPISVFGVSSIPSRGVRKGQIVNIEETTESISQSLEAAERMAGFSVGSAFVSIGGFHVTSQNSHGIVAVADPKKEIVESDVERVIEAARAINIPSTLEILHCLPRSFMVDGQEGIKDPIGMTGVRLEVDTHIITALTTAVRNLGRAVSEVGVDIEDVVFSGYASSLSVLSETEKELGVALVDIGGGTTGISLFCEGALSYSAVLPIGARNITNDLAVGLRLSLESAERIKLLLTESPKSKDEKKDDVLDLRDLNLPEGLKNLSRKTMVEGIIKPRVAEILSMVSAEIKKSDMASLIPSGIVITGGGALTAGLLETAKHILVLPLRLGFPTGVTGLTEEISTPSFATVIGLLLHGAKYKKLGRKEGISGIQRRVMQKISLTGSVGKIWNFFRSFLP